MLMLSFHDAGAACKNGQVSGKGHSQEAAPGGVPHTGTGSSDTVGQLS